ncbi:hypothetical protein [Aliarcobacter cryaerophilus]|uniref:hypothetical protein n=1 Tax=Aliarcobacter cryaerophilus TaxID=28198 RepID=UPI003DA3745B
MKKEYLYTIFMLIFLFLQVFFYGVSDFIAFLLLISATSMMFFTIHKFHISSREILRINTQENSKLHNFLTGKSITTISTAILISFIASIILITILKAIVINHGFWSILTIIILCSLFVIGSMKMFSYKPKIIEENIHLSIIPHLQKFMFLFYLVFIFDLIITIALTYFDYQSFIENNISLGNFEEFAFKNKIIFNDSNKWSMIMINAYLLLDSFKIAFTNFIYEILEVEKTDYFFMSILLIGFFNFVKLLGFSFAFVYLQTTIVELVDKYYDKKKILKEEKLKEKS